MDFSHLLLVTNSVDGLDTCRLSLFGFLALVFFFQCSIGWGQAEWTDGA